MIVPRKIVFTGDPVAGSALKGAGDSVLRITRGERQLRGLREHSVTRRFSDGTVIQAYVGFCNDDIVRIHVPPPPGGEPPPVFKCFANTGMALAQVLGIVGYDVLEDGDILDPITGLRIDTYPSSYYGSKTIKYDLAVCDGHGEYVLYEDVYSTDYTVHRPGDIVLVILNRTTNVPERQVYRNTEHPCAEQPFTLDLMGFSDVIAVIPIETALPLVEI